MWVHALLSFGFVQLLAFALALLRVPLVIRALGVPGFGRLSLITAMLPWFGLLGLSTRAAARILESECSQHGGMDPQGLHAVLRPSLVVGRVCALGGGCLLAAIGLGGMGGSSHSRLLAGTALCLLCTGTITRGSVILGLLEARGKALQVNVLTGVATVVGFLGTVGCSVFSAPFWAFTLTVVAPVYGPAWLALITWRRVRPQPSDQRPSVVGARSPNARLVWRLALTAGVQQVQNGLDPFTIAWALGPVAVSQYAIVNRLGQALSVPPVALQPVLVRHFGQLRMTQTPERLRRSQLKLSAIMAAGVLALGIVFVPAGPTLVSLLAPGGRLTAPTMLFVAFALLNVILGWQVPLLAALGGAAGTRLVARWIPVVAGVNLAGSIALAHLGVWWPTAVSIVVATCAHAVLYIVVKRKPLILKVSHTASGTTGDGPVAVRAARE